MQKKITNKLLSCMASTAEDLFWEALGLASCGGAYEPKLSDKASKIKAAHTSKIEALYNKLTK